jgi:hypothetical protein
MPFCPVCRYEYVEGAEKCPDCDAELDAELPPEPEEVWSDEPMVPVFHAGNRAEADIIVGVLGDASIRAWFRPEGWSRAIVEIPGQADAGPVFVLASHEDEAKKAIEEAMAGGDENLGSADV